MQNNTQKPEEYDLERRLYQPQWDRATRLLITIVLIVGGIYVLSLISPVLQLLAFTFLITFVMYPPSMALTRQLKIPWVASVFMLYALVVSFVLALVLNVLPTLVNSVNNLIDGAEDRFTELQLTLADYQPEDGIIVIAGTNLDLNPIIMPFRDFIVEGAISLPEDNTTPDTASDEVDEPLQTIDLSTILGSIVNVAGTITNAVTGAISSVTGFITTLLLATFVSFLTILELPRMELSLATWIPSAYNREYTLLIAKIRQIWSGFFRGQVTIGIIIGLLTWIQLKVMGVPGAEVLAIFTGFISLIPTLGGFIALVPLSIIPLLQGSTVMTDLPNVAFALLVVVVNLVISQVIWNVIAPKILGDAVNLPVPVIIVGIFIGAAAGGILGAFLVTPIISTVWSVVVYLLHKIGQQDPFPGEEPITPLGAGLLAPNEALAEEPFSLTPVDIEAEEKKGFSDEPTSTVR